MKSFKRFIGDLQIKSICNKYNINNYTINEDGSIDVDGDVNLTRKSLINIPLKFRNVSYFYCDNNQLTSLEGCPQSVVGDFTCHNNQLTSLKGCPQSVGVLNCRYNQLTSLEGCPEIIGGNIFCQFNKINSFKGISEFFENGLYCDNNPIFEIYYLFRQNVKCIKWINEWDVIQDGNKIILDRLEEVYHQLNMDIPENIKFKYYEII